MMVLGFVILVLVIVTVAILCSYGESTVVFLGLICGAGLFFSVMCITEDVRPTPTALDVYKDKTTLRITYVDSVAVDSVVVFK